MSDQTIARKTQWVQEAVEQYEGPLVRYALGIMDNLDQARDVVQDVFIRLWQADQAQVENHLAEWLFRVCRNRALDNLRKENRMQQPEDGLLQLRMSHDPTPDHVVEHREDVREILSYLKDLPPNQQEVIRLKFQNDLSYQEISRITCLSVTNVGYLIHTAIKTLRHKVQAAEQRCPMR